MRFKEWYVDSEDRPSANTNGNMPCQSKISTRDGSSRLPPDQFDAGQVGKPERLFKFTPRDKIGDRERTASWIDTYRRRAGFTTIPPDSTK
jgi:hypothetical protein